MVQTRKCDALPCFGSSSRSGKINCARCQKTFHLKFAGLTTNQLKFVRDCPGAVWLCLICRNTTDFDQSAANLSFSLILERISSVIRLVGRQIEVTRSLCRAFGQDPIPPSNSSLQPCSQVTDDRSRNFVEELDNLQLDFTNEFNSLVETADQNSGSNQNRSSSPSAVLSSSDVRQERAVLTTVAEVHTNSTMTGAAAIATSSMPDSAASTNHPANASSTAANNICPGNINQDICPTEASSDTAPPSNISHVADNISTLLPAIGQSRKDAATQSHLPPTFQRDATSCVPANNFVRPDNTQISVPGITQPTREAATQSHRSGNLGPGICPAGVANGTALSHPMFHPIPAPFYGNPAIVQQPLTNIHQLSHQEPTTKPPAVPYTPASMPFWYLPPPTSSISYPSFVDSRIPLQMLPPSNNVSGPAAVSTRGASTTSHVKPPTLPRQLPPYVNTMSILHPPANARPSRKPVAPVVLSGTTEPAEKFKQFYITPFEPSTTAEHISNYIRSKTGWIQTSFRCQPLTSAARKGRPLSFVSFKVLVLDNPVFTNTITKNGFWPSFVSVTPFEPRPRK